MIRRIRLITGLVLFVYVTTHLLNHALGVISLAAMEEGRVWFLAAWRGPIGTIALYGSLLAHLLLALYAIYERRTLRMSPGEMAQLGLGLAIPILLAEHIVGTRLASVMAGATDSYSAVLLIHWKIDRSNIVVQTAALLAAWAHGSIGMHYWLRLKPWYRSYVWLLYGAAILVPVLALLGYVAGGREVLAADQAWQRAVYEAYARADPATVARLHDVIVSIWVGVPTLFVLALLARVVRSVVEQRLGMVRITYPGGRTIAAAAGESILDVSRRIGYPHASVCGGRGRCSTCRVRILRGMDMLPPPTPAEQRVLDRIGKPHNVRLACQTRPKGDVEMLPLLPANATAAEGFARPAHLQGEEREIAILFADLRSFTQFAEKRLPYDVVFVLNRYFANMGEAVGTSGGHLDKFIGDGVMALFGIDGDPIRGCRQSLLAARTMAEKLKELNSTLSAELPEPLRIGIGVHVGPAIIGEMGYGPATHLTAIGDSVNTASRLETLTKEFKAQLVVSEDVALRAGVDLSRYPSHDIEVRGRAEPVRVRVVVDALTLAV